MLHPSKADLGKPKAEAEQADGLIVCALGWVEGVLWVIESLVGLVMVAPSFPCSACGGRIAEPIEVTPAVRIQLEASLLLLLGSTDGGATDWVDLFSGARIVEAAALGGLTAAELRRHLAPVAEAFESAAASGISESAGRSIADGRVGDLVAPTPCVCP